MGAGGIIVGEIGFADLKRDETPSIHGVPELGWALAPAFHGKGYATEGVRAALGYAKAHRTTFNGAPVVMFERLRGAN